MKLLLVDDHKLLLSGLQALMAHWAGDYEVIPCSTIDCARQHLLQDRRIDIVVADLQMPANRGALELLDWMSQQSLNIPVLVLSALEYPDIARRARLAGAMGYIEKSSGHDALHAAIDCVAGGGSCFPAHWADVMESGQQRATVADGEQIIQIPPRLMRVIPLIREGFTNRQMAQDLKLAENTIKGYIKELYKLLDVNNRTECIYRAEQLGLFDF